MCITEDDDYNNSAYATFIEKNGVEPTNAHQLMIFSTTNDFVKSLNWTQASKQFKKYKNLQKIQTRKKRSKTITTTKQTTSMIPS